MTEIIRLGKIKTAILKSEFGNLQTDEIIVTGERIEHIKQRHPEDFDLFAKYGTVSVSNPDFIIRDIKNKGTVFMVKKLPDTNLNLVVKRYFDLFDTGLLRTLCSRNPAKYS